MTSLLARLWPQRVAPAARAPSRAPISSHVSQYLRGSTQQKAQYSRHQSFHLVLYARSVGPFGSPQQGCCVFIVFDTYTSLSKKTRTGWELGSAWNLSISKLATNLPVAIIRDHHEQDQVNGEHHSHHSLLERTRSPRGILQGRGSEQGRSVKLMRVS